MNAAEFYLEDLKSKFSKIDPDQYYLAYSGGRDSHFLLWFIREYLHETRIPAVFNNTGMEIPEIRQRALANCDVVLKPAMKHFEIKEKYGIPLNTKQSDMYVWEYQHRREKGISDEDMPGWVKYYALRDVNGTENGRKTGLIPFTAVNARTCLYMRGGVLHKVSPFCCKYLKKIPGIMYRKETSRKPILGLMGMESLTRGKINTCFRKDGAFRPIWDLTDTLQHEIEKEFEIPVPNIYFYVHQTGCAGCPYGQHGKDRFFNTNLTLNLCKEGQRNFILEYFKESYEFKGYEFKPMLFQAEGIYG